MLMFQVLKRRLDRLAMDFQWASDWHSQQS